MRISYWSSDVCSSDLLAQLQVGHAVELVDGQVADPALPVESQRAAGIDAGDRRDHGVDPEVVAAVVVVQLGQEDRLVPAAAVERELHAHYVWVLHGDAVVAGADVAADLLEVLHGAVSRSRMAAMLAQWPKRPPSSASSPRSAPCRAGRWPATATSRAGREIGRASCRERVCQYVWISVVAVSLKKKQ